MVSAGGTATPRKRIVLIDATNVLARSFSSPSEARRIKPRDVFRLWTEYLASSADVVVGVFDNPGNQGKPGSVLYVASTHVHVSCIVILTYNVTHILKI